MSKRDLLKMPDDFGGQLCRAMLATPYRLRLVTAGSVGRSRAETAQAKHGRKQAQAEREDCPGGHRNRVRDGAGSQEAEGAKKRMNGRHKP
jgi:hypothetical protein